MAPADAARSSVFSRNISSMRFAGAGVVNLRKYRLVALRLRFLLFLFFLFPCF